MSGSVIMRTSHEEVEGSIIHNDRAMSWEEADKRAGFRLDRRRSWAFIPHENDSGVPELCSLVTFSRSCCDCTDEDPYRAGAKGWGCSACGYTGRCRAAYFVPHTHAGDPA